MAGCRSCRDTGTRKHRTSKNAHDNHRTEILRLGHESPPPRPAPLGLIGAAFVLGVDKYLSFEVLRDNRAFLPAFVHDNALLAAVVFIAGYAAATALSLPGGAILSVAARTALGDVLKAKAGPWLKKMEQGFNENALSYLLVLRLVPMFPFFVVNLVPAFLGVPLRTYALGTVLGIIPGTFVFVSVGAGLGSVFDLGDAFSPASALTSEVITALVGLSVLSLVPVAYKKLKSRPAPAG